MRARTLLFVLVLAPACDSSILDGTDGGALPDATNRRDAAAATDATAAIDLAKLIDLTMLPDAGPSSTRQAARPLGATTAPNGFYEYLPPGYSKSGSSPLIVFHHGIGEDGNGTTDLAKVLANGPPMLIGKNQWPNDRPFIVLAPQTFMDGCWRTPSRKVCG